MVKTSAVAVGEDPDDYDRVLEDDRIDILGLSAMKPGKQMNCVINHADGTTEQIKLNHSYNQTQIEWFKKGSFLNLFHST